MTAIIYVMFIFSYCYADKLLSHGGSCDNKNINSCPNGTMCSSDKNNVSRCLCNKDQYRTDHNSCLPINNLLVKGVRTKQIRTNSVELEWSNITFDIMSSRIKVSYNNNSTFFSPNSTARIYSLEPNTSYNFTIQVVIFSDDWYSYMNGPEYLHSARTSAKKTHNDQCNTTTDVCQDETACVLDSTNISRCLCNQYHYRNDDNICVTLGELALKNITTTLITTDSLKLSWCDTSINKYTAKYGVSYGTNITVFGEAYGIVLNHLKPETVYTIEIKVIIPPENYYGQRNGTPFNFHIKTASAYSFGMTAMTRTLSSKWPSSRSISTISTKNHQISTKMHISETQDTSTKIAMTSDAWTYSRNLITTFISIAETSTKNQPSTNMPMTKVSQYLIIYVSVCVAVFILIIILLILVYIYRKNRIQSHLCSSSTNPGGGYKQVSVSISPETIHTELVEPGLQQHWENEVNRNLLLATNNKYETIESVAYSTVHMSNSVTNKSRSPSMNNESAELSQEEKHEAVYSHLAHNRVQGPRNIEHIYNG